MIGGALICWWTGKHRRGKPIEGLEGTLDRRYFECPRCGRITSYKTKGAAHAERRTVPLD